MAKDWSYLETRYKPTILEEKEIIETGSNLINHTEKKLYEYCLCDYCLGKVIFKDSKQCKSNGRIFEYRNPRGRKFQMALHSKCLKPALIALNDFYERRDTNEEKQDS